MMLFLIVTFTLFYLIPFLVSYFWIRHKFKTEWKNINPDLGVIVIVIIPVLNIGTATWAVSDFIFNLLEEISNEIEKSNINKKINEKGICNKFFKL